MIDNATSLADDIARVVLDHFDRLPKKQKPQIRSNDAQEWVPLSGIVLRRYDRLECVALATGMKCITQARLCAAKGIVLHDQHAEILAVRAFNRFLLDQCLHLLQDKDCMSDYVCARSPDEINEVLPHPFRLAEGIQIYLYCSEAPCGDASMELIMQAQQDATPWERPNASTNLDSDGADGLLGRGCFSHLGAVRRKPARPDAPISSSKSCTDKIAMYQAVSLLRSLPSMLVLPQGCYLTGVVLPRSQYVSTACDRAFGTNGRFTQITAEVTSSWCGRYSFQPVEILTTNYEFAYCRRVWPPGTQLSPCNISAVWTPSWQETLVNGVLQGRKAGDLRGASKLSKRDVWVTVVEISRLLGNADSMAELSRETYAQVKAIDRLQSRREVKNQIIKLALDKWPRTVEDSNFGLETT